MGPGETWFHFIPGLTRFTESLQHAMGNGWIFGTEHTSDPAMHHVVMSVAVTAFLIVLGVKYRAALAATKDGGIVPARAFGFRAVVETICDTAIDMMSGIMGPKAARDFLPLIGTMAFFILFSNLFGLVPGLAASTDTLSTTAACAVVIFVATHWYGTKINGWNHWKHLFGPVLWLAPLMFVIEIVSHLARPVSLSLRLMGNMVGDHSVLLIFLGLVPILLPVPIMALGLLVCVVQALVFCLLSVVYIGLAIEQHDEHVEAH